MMKTNLSYILILFLGTTAICANDEKYIEYVQRINSIPYMIKEGDTIGEVLKRNGYSPLLGLDGAINKTLNKNGIRKNEVNKIGPGTVIYLPYRKGVKSNIPERRPASIANTFKTKESTPVETKNKKKRAALSLMFSTSSSALTSTDIDTSSEAHLQGKLGLGIGLKWSQFWGEKNNWETYIISTIQKIEFSTPEDYELEEKSITQLYQGLGLGYRFDNYQSLGFNLGQGQSLVLLARDNDTLYVSPQDLMAYSLYGNHPVVRYHGLSISLGWRVGSLVPKKSDVVEVKSGEFYHGNIGLSYMTDDYVYFSQLGYTTRSLTTEVTEQTSIQLSTSFGISFKY